MEKAALEVAFFFLASLLYMQSASCSGRLFSMHNHAPKNPFRLIANRYDDVLSARSVGLLGC